MAGPTTFGIKHSMNASANGPTHCGSEKVVRKARPTGTGFGPAPLRRADTSLWRLPARTNNGFGTEPTAFGRNAQ